MKHPAKTQQEAAEIQAWTGQNDGVQELNNDYLLSGQSAASCVYHGNSLRDSLASPLVAIYGATPCGG
jgi:hypothetical protein